MTLRTETALLLSLPLSVMLGLAACGDDAPVAEDETAGSETATETGDGDGDTTPGDGDGDTTPGDGDGDTDPGDGDGDGCPVGSEGCPCTGGGACDQGLMCDAGVCVPASGDGDGDGGDGDGDGDAGDGDGDGDSLCVGDEQIAIEAEDADTIVGWDPVMSMLGEDIVLDWDETVPDAFIEFDLDIPCEGDWHVWVRAINAGQADSFFVQVDGGPMPIPIFEINCDPGPQQATYEWRELNWRDPMAPGCEYVEDPWVQAWAVGPHTFTLGYRESYAISKIWLTTSDMPPP